MQDHMENYGVIPRKSKEIKHKWPQTFPSVCEKDIRSNHWDYKR